MKFNKNLTKQKWFAYTVATCSAVVLYLLLTHISYYIGSIWSFFAMISPIVIGIIIAYLLSPICGFFERRIAEKTKKPAISRTLGVVLTLLLVIAVFVLLIVTLIPQLVNSVGFLISNMYNYVGELEVQMDDYAEYFASMNINIDDISDKFMDFINDFVSTLPQKIDGFVSTGVKVGVTVTNFVLGFFISIYLLMDEKRMVGGIQRLFRAWLPVKKYNSMASFWGTCNNIMLRYLGLSLLDGAIIGIVNFVFMLLFGMPYAVLVSVIVGITNLAPTFGPIVGGVIGGFILVLVNPVHALIFIVFTILLQTLDGYVIKPKLFGSSLGIPAVWILISIIVGGKLFGVAGILLAIPFASIVNFIFEDHISKRLDEKEAQHKKEFEEEQERDAKGVIEDVVIEKETKTVGGK